jgi:hypothetical protein
MAKPKLALIPAAQGSKFYSVLPSDGVGDFDFARASAATRINKYGLIETVASGQSRLNYPLIDGVVNGCPSHLLEPQRLQLIQYSEDFSQGYWIKSGSSVVSGFVSPKGDLSAFKLLDNTINGVHWVFTSITGTYSALTISCYMKKGERDWGFIRTRSAISDRYAYFNLKTGVVGTVESDLTASIQSVGNGWYRCVVVCSSPTSSSNPTVIGTTNADNVFTYTGDGTSGIYIFGAQLEAGSYPTSYIPNFGTALGVTRSAETANNSGDASTFNDSEGVLMAEIEPLVNDASLRTISISDGTGSNEIFLQFSNSTSRIECRVIVGGVLQSQLLYIFPNSNEFLTMSKFALKYKENDFSLWVNGTEKVVDASGSVPSNNVLDLLKFERAAAGQEFYGNIKQVQYYDSALNDSELEKISSWTSFSEMAQGQLYSIQ